jgi:hypothetical protein
MEKMRALVIYGPGRLEFMEGNTHGERRRGAHKGEGMWHMRFDVQGLSGENGKAHTPCGYGARICGGAGRRAG